MALVFEFGKPPRLAEGTLQEVKELSIAILIKEHEDEFNAIMGRVYSDYLEKEIKEHEF